MKSKLFAVLTVAVGLLTVSGSSFAHHGGAKYDGGRLITVEGTITKYDIINPHGRLYFSAKGKNGEVQEWFVELSALNMMRRLGWSKGTFKPGDPITATGNPAKDGSHEMRLFKAVLVRVF